MKRKGARPGEHPLGGPGAPETTSGDCSTRRIARSVIEILELGLGRVRAARAREVDRTAQYLPVANYSS